MTYTAHDPRLFINAVIVRLADTGRPVGDATGAGLAEPFSVVYPMPDLATDGPLSDPQQVTVYAFQLTCIGLTREQAQWMQHKARSVLLGWTPTVAGIGTTRVALHSGSGIRRNDDVTPPEFYSTDLYRMYASS
jgi:hypothetical protein